MCHIICSYQIIYNNKKHFYARVWVRISVDVLVIIMNPSTKNHNKINSAFTDVSVELSPKSKHIGEKVGSWSRINQVCSLISKLLCVSMHPIVWLNRQTILIIQMVFFRLWRRKFFLCGLWLFAQFQVLALPIDHNWHELTSTVRGIAT